MTLPVLKAYSSPFAKINNIDTFGISSGRHWHTIPYTYTQVIDGETVTFFSKSLASIVSTIAPVQTAVHTGECSVLVQNANVGRFENVYTRTSREYLAGLLYDDGSAVATTGRATEKNRPMDIYASGADSDGNVFLLVGPGVVWHTYYSAQNDSSRFGCFNRIFINHFTSAINAPAPEPSVNQVDGGVEWGQSSCMFTLLKLPRSRTGIEDADVVDWTEIATFPGPSSFVVYQDILTSGPSPVNPSDTLSQWERRWYSPTARYHNLIANSAFFISHKGRTWVGFDDVTGYDTILEVPTIPARSYSPALREITGLTVGSKLNLGISGHTVTYQGTPPVPFYINPSSGYTEADFVVQMDLADANAGWSVWGGTMTDAPVKIDLPSPYYAPVRSRAGFAWLVRNGINQTVHMYTADMEFPDGASGTFINGAYAGQLPWKPTQISGLTVARGVFVVVVRDANGLWLGGSADGANWAYIKKLADASELDTRQPNLWYDDLLAKPGEGLNVLVSDSAACAIKNVY